MKGFGVSPTSILQRKIGICIDECTACVLYASLQSAITLFYRNLKQHLTITIQYFNEDTAYPETPAVGNYVTVTGKVDAIDPVFRTMQLNGAVIAFENLLDIKGDGIVEIDKYLGISEE